MNQRPFESQLQPNDPEKTSQDKGPRWQMLRDSVLAELSLTLHDLHRAEAQDGKGDPEESFWLALARLKFLNEAPSEIRPGWIEYVKKITDNLAISDARRALLEAELLYSTAANPDVICRFDVAMQRAKDEGRIDIELLACRRVTHCLQAQGSVTIASLLLKRSQDLLEQYWKGRDLVAKANPEDRSDQIRVLSLLTESYALDSAAEPARFVEGMLRGVLETTQSTRGVLILNVSTENSLVAEAIRQKGEIVVLLKPEEESGNLAPLSIIDHVIRTSEAACWQDALPPDGEEDPYFKSHSIPFASCCLPIRRHPNCTGALYLESERSIPEGSMAILEWVASQAAVSIENAILYQELHQENQERKRVEEALRENEWLLQSVLDNSPAVIYVKDREGRYLSVNRSFAELFEDPSQDFVGKTDHELFTQDRADAYRAFDRRVMETGKTEQREEVAYLPDGSHIYVSIKTPLRDAEGNIQGICGITTDITGLRKGEEALRKTEQDYLALVDSIDGIVWEADARTWEFSYVSKRAERLLGYPVENWLEDPEFWADHIHPEDREATVNYCVATTAAKQNHDFVYRMIAADGRVLWLRDIVNVVLENDEPVKIRGIMVDITAERNALEALRTSQQLLQSVIDNSTAIVYVKDANGRYELVNHQFMKLFGDGAPSVIGKSDYDVFERTQAKAYREIDQRVIQEKRVIEAEETATLADGIHHYISIKSPLFDESGNAFAMCGISTDVTEDRRLTEQIRLLQTITLEIVESDSLESALEVILRQVCEKTGWVFGQAWIPRRQEEILDCGPAWFVPDPKIQQFRNHCIAQAYPKGKALPGYVWETFSPVWVKDVTADATNTRMPYSQRADFKVAFGVPIVVEEELIAIIEFFMREERREDDRIVSLITSIAAQLGLVIQRKRAEEAQLRLAKIIDISADAIIILDEDLRIVSFNRGAEQVFGYSAAEAIGQFLNLLIPHRIRDIHGTWVQRFAESKADILNQTEVQGLRHDGTEFPADATVTKLTDGGRISFAVFLRDATERKRTEDEIRSLNEDLERRVQDRTAELVSVNKELEAFCYSVSHDLRSPLRSIDGFSQLLIQELGDRLSADGQDYLSRTRAAAQRMGILIDALLGLSRVTRVSMRTEEVDLSKLALAVAADLNRTNQDRKVQFHASPNLTARGDGTLLRIAFENLIGNAWKYTGKKSAAKVEFGAVESPDHGTVFYVKDNGAGFDMNYAHNLFVPFSRLHSDASFEGTGVGLATIQRIIERHGGQVWAEGREGEGATFFFTLP